MLMVILGAGASYDSAQAYRVVLPGGGAQNFGVNAAPVDNGGPWRPPLARDLFQDRYRVLGDIVRKYPKLSHILPYLREPSKGRSVEQMLEDLQEEGKGDPESAREFASVRYYLCELLLKVTNEWISRTNGVTNYAPLLKDILRFRKEGELVFLVTFNYDLLLESALYTFDFKPKEPEEHFLSHPILKLFKLHGSVNWSRYVNLPAKTRLQPQGLIEKAPHMEIRDTFVRAIATEPQDMFRFDQPIFPAIAIPVQTKSKAHFECPESHLSYLAQGLRRVTKILLIGWQAQEAHFLQMLRSNLPNLAHLMVVGQDASEAGRIGTYFLEQIRWNVPNLLVAKGGFTDFIVNQEGSSFFQT
jgi:hypothetical protein